MQPDARWLEHLAQLCRRLNPDPAAGPGSPPAHPGVNPAPSRPSAHAENPISEQDRGAAWVVVRDGLMRFLRSQAGRFGEVSSEDLEDLASMKALELVSRAESGEWSIQGRSNGELAGYLATVTRHALVDFVKRRGRMVRQPDSGGDATEAELRDALVSAPAPGPDAPVLAHEFITALRGCLLELEPRARRVWFFRVFYDMGSHAIASHPSIALQSAHVDVVMQRARARIRSCMEHKGFEVKDFPRGGFTALWTFVESLRDEMPDTDSKAAGQ